MTRTNKLISMSRGFVFCSVVTGCLWVGDTHRGFGQDLGGLNLFGERVEATAEEDVAANPNSQNVQRAKVMIDRVLEIDSGIQDVQAQRTTQTAERLKLESLIKQVPDQIQAWQAEALRLINFPTPSELRTREQQLKILATQINAARQQLEQSKIRLKTVYAELNQGELQTKNLHADALELQHGWAKLLSILDYLPPSEARQIEALCQRKLDQYPEAQTVRMMQGFARIHLGRLEAAKQDLQHCNQALRNAPQSLYASFKIRCLVGLGWIEIQLGNLGEAAAQLAEARKLDSRDYEVAVCVSHIAHLRERSDTALTLYQRATTIDPKHPAGFRMAAEMVCQSKVRPANIAVQLATKACKVDEFGDFRNQLALARAQHYAGNTAAVQTAIASAKQQAGKEAAELIAKLEDELTPAR